MKSILLLQIILAIFNFLVHGHPVQPPVDDSLLIRQSNPLNPFLSIITNLPPINLAVDGADVLMENAEGQLEPLCGGPINQSDLAIGAPCAQMTIIFARGTTEPGNMGVFTGPEFVNAVKNAMTGTTINVQGVEYDASFQGYLAGGGADGTASMSKFVNKAASQCPSTKIVMSGYSQGARVVHNTAKILSSDVMARVSSVVVFGDPQNQTAVQGAEGKTLVICHSDDDICSFGDIILPTHLTYGLLNSPQAGAYVAQMASKTSNTAQAQSGTVESTSAAISRWNVIMGWRSWICWVLVPSVSWVLIL